MATDLSISLRPWPEKESSNSQSLSSFISRINQQRGSFRHVTEASLEQEIWDAEAGQAKVEDDINEAEGHDGAPTKDHMGVAREEIAKQIAQAHNESCYALEFISLLLSKHSKSAEMTMSPFLKQNIPIGSLGVEVNQPPAPSATQARDEGLVALAWKIQSLGVAADSLLQSATRLKSEIERETTYWDEIIAVKQKGWSLCRLPRERHTLGVRYGFGEAHPDFRERGLAALRRSEDGHIVFDRGVTMPSHKKIRVRVQQHGQVMSTMHVPSTETTEKPSLGQQLSEARNSLYDEELHHEIHREARGMASHGVKCIGDTIILPHDDDEQILIDIIPSSGGVSEKCRNDDLADWVTLALRLLLSHAHRQNLRRRSQIPAALTERRATRPTYSILYPILQFFQHRRAVQSLLPDLADRWGGSLECSRTRDDGSTKRVTADYLLERVGAPFRSSFMLRLPSSSSSVSVLVETRLTAPTFGTVYQMSWEDAHDPLLLQFPSLDELEDYVLHAPKQEGQRANITLP